MSDFDPVDIRGQERARSEIDESERIAAEREVEDLKWLMSNKRGRRFMFRLLERAGVWRSSFNTNALAMAFSEGTRNEGLKLTADLTTHCSDRYGEMLKENWNR